MKISHSIHKKLKKITLIVSDVDGVLTDGKIIIDKDGGEIKTFFNRDGTRVDIALASGLSIILVTGRKGGAVLKRSQELNLPILYKADFAKNNTPLLDLLVKKYSITTQEILYIGDDWTDIFYMTQVGVSVTPSNGSLENQQIASITTKAKGGEGVLAEVIELVMKERGTWQTHIDKYYKQFIP